MEKGEHHLTHPAFNFMRKEPKTAKAAKERILVSDQSESVILENEIGFITKENFRLAVYVTAFISILVAILGSVWIVMRIIWKQGKEEFIENPVRRSDAPGRIRESYAQQEERQERYRDAKYRSNINLSSLMSGGSMQGNGMY